MADKIDISLDDYIKSNKSQFRTGRGRGGGRGRGTGQRGRGIRGGRGGGRGGVPGGLRSQSRGGGAGGTFRGGVQSRSSRGANQQGGFNRTKQVPDVWQHDMFEGGVSAGITAKRFLTTGAVGGMGSVGKLLVSNLDYGVSDSDIKELFAEFGPLRKAAVHYDRSGRSMGTAEVLFERRGDAVKALKQYNNVPLDGRPMNIQIIGSESMQQPQRVMNGRPPQRSPGGFGGGGQRWGRGGIGRGRGGPVRGRGGRGGQNRKTPTAEELDAQLDAYNSKMDTD